MVESELDITAIAVDWVAENLYWSIGAREGARIEVRRLDSGTQRVIVWEDIDPFILAVNPKFG